MNPQIIADAWQQAQAEAQAQYAAEERAILKAQYIQRHTVVHCATRLLYEAGMRIKDGYYSDAYKNVHAEMVSLFWPDTIPQDRVIQDVTPDTIVEWMRDSLSYEPQLPEYKLSNRHYGDTLAKRTAKLGAAERQLRDVQAWAREHSTDKWPTLRLQACQAMGFDAEAAAIQTWQATIRERVNAVVAEAQRIRDEAAQAVAEYPRERVKRIIDRKPANRRYDTLCNLIYGGEWLGDNRYIVKRTAELYERLGRIPRQSPWNPDLDALIDALFEVAQPAEYVGILLASKELVTAAVFRSGDASVLIAEDVAWLLHRSQYGRGDAAYIAKAEVAGKAYRAVLWTRDGERWGVALALVQDDDYLDFSEEVTKQTE